jgi:RecA-family ATPase
MLVKGIRDGNGKIDGNFEHSAGKPTRSNGAGPVAVPVQAGQGAGASERQRPCCQRSALAWAAWGFPVFRLGEGVKEAAGLAFTTPGFAFVSPAEIFRNFPAGRQFNIGWRTGWTPTSNTLVIDLDVKNGQDGPGTLLRAAADARAGLAARSLASLAQQTRAMLVATPSGGFHLIWSGAGLPQYSQSNARWLTRFGASCGVDVRAHNGYALAPGSWLPGQGQYRLLECPLPGEGLGAVPEWVRALLITREERRRGALTVEGKNGTAAIRLNGVLVSGPGTGGEKWSAATIEDAKRYVLGRGMYAPRGQRNNKGFQVAAYLRRDMAFGFGLARELMEIWAEGNSEEPLEAHELDLLARQGETGSRALGAGNFEALHAGSDIRIEDGGKGEGVPIPAVNGGPEETHGARAAFASAANGAGVSCSTRALIVNEGRPRFIESERPFWPGFLDRGYFTLLTGERKIGKSQYLFWLAATVSKGGDWPARVKGEGENGEGENGRAEKGDVYLLTCEDDYAKKIVPRLAAYGADFGHIIHVEGTKDGEGKMGWFNLKEDLDLLGAKMRERRGQGKLPQLLIVDPISGYTGKTKVNDEGEVRAAIQGLNKFAADWDICLIGLRHPRKAAGATGDRTSGSHAWEDVPRRVYELQIDEEDESEDRWKRKRFLFNTHYQYGKPGGTLVFGIKEKVVDVSLPGDSSHFQTLSVIEFEPETSEITADENYKRKMVKKNEEIKGENIDENSLQKTKNWILEELANCTHMSAVQLFERALNEGHKKRTFERARVELRRDKKVCRDQEKGENSNEWIWKITEIGLEYVRGLPRLVPSV